MEHIRIANSNGKDLAVSIERPAISTEKLAVLCPGYLDSKDYQHLTDLSAKLVEQDFICVRFDPTGTWGSEGEISEYLTSQYLKDIESVFEYMLQEHAYTTVLVGGHSRGGQVSILYAARDSRITHVLAIMPSHRPVTGKRREEWEAAGVSHGIRDIPGKEGKREYDVPFTHVLDRDQFDALKDVENIAAFKVFVAGEHDVLVPPESVRELYDAACEPKRFILIEGIDHEYRHIPAAIEKVNTILISALKS